MVENLLNSGVNHIAMCSMTYLYTYFHMNQAKDKLFEPQDCVMQTCKLLMPSV